jgi:hypothetical protein
MPRKRKSNIPPPLPTSNRLVVPSDGSANPKAFYHVAMAAREERVRLAEVEAECIRRLRALLPPGKSSFSMEGRVYQIRERNGTPYFVMMPLAEEVSEI